MAATGRPSLRSRRSRRFDRRRGSSANPPSSGLRSSSWRISFRKSASSHGFRYGADYYLPKPCEAHQILDVVDYYADRLDREERQFLEGRL